MLFGLVLIVAIILVARFDKDYNSPSNGYDVKCVQPSDPSMAATSLACTIKPIQNTDQSEAKPPWWHKLIAWPEGITAWLLMLTLGAIGWQSWETRKAAENAGMALVFQQEALRPRLKVNEFINNVLHEAVAGEWVIVNMKISNSGGLPAYGVIADTWIEFVWGESPYKLCPIAKYARADVRLNVHAGHPSGFFIPLHAKLTETERYAMGHAKATICFRVKLTYHALGQEVHTDEAWSVGLDGMQSIAEYSSET